MHQNNKTSIRRTAVTIAVADCRITHDIENALYGYADKIIKLPPYSALAEPVASHPDMLLWRVGRKIVTYGAYAEIAKDELLSLLALGFELVTESALPSASYPDDVRLNCATVGKHAIANLKYTSEHVRKSGLTLLHANQGYTKCSTVVVSDNAIITSDPSVFDTAMRAGIGALKISEGHVRLDGYGTGFIGGASGVTDEAVLFTGDLSSHPDAEKIEEFCARHGKRAVSLSSSSLYDYGTVFFFN